MEKKCLGETESEREETIALMKGMMEQNHFIIQKLFQGNVQPTEPKFQVMPDLTKTISDFYGTGEEVLGELWLKEIEAVTTVNNWPDEILMETTRSHLKGAAKSWFPARGNEINN